MSTRTLLTLKLVALNAALLTGAVLAQTPTPDPMATPPVANPPPANPTTSGTPPALPPPKEHHNHVKLMDAIEKLNLTDAQKAQIQKINDSSVDNKEKHKEIKEVLTPDQQDQLKEIMHPNPPPAT